MFKKYEFILYFTFLMSTYQHWHPVARVLPVPLALSMWRTGAEYLHGFEAYSLSTMLENKHVPGPHGLV